MTLINKTNINIQNMDYNNTVHIKDLWDTIVHINSCFNSEKLDWESVLKLFERSAGRAGIDLNNGHVTPETAVNVLRDFSQSLDYLADDLLDQMCNQETSRDHIYEIGTRESLSSLEKTLWEEAD